MGGNMFLEHFYNVYVLLSQRDNKFYIGFTNDLLRRFKEHEQGKNISTARRLPLKLIYFEGHLSKKDALRRESYFKTTKGKVTLRQMLRESLLSNLPGSC
jgi:putative endonuclease